MSAGAFARIERAVGGERAHVDDRGRDGQRRDHADRAHLALLQERHRQRNRDAEDADRRGERRQHAAEVAEQQRGDQRVPRRWR